MKKKPTKKPKKLSPLERIAIALEKIVENHKPSIQELERPALPEIKGYKVRPINTVEGISKYFDWVYNWITPEHCPLKPVNNLEKDIELIKFDKYLSTDDAIKEIAAQGYVPAPSNYLLGLGVQYPEIHKGKKWIVSLDKQNLFADQDGIPCFLCLGWGDERCLHVVYGTGVWGDGWWFAVVRK